jgi:four helix bundle protein
MFDFEKLDVYNEVRDVNKKVQEFVLNDQSIPTYLRDNFKDTSLNILLHLADGTSRMTRNEKRSLYSQARGNVFVCVALLQTMVDLNMIDQANYQRFYDGYERVSKMLLGMIRSADGRNNN